MGLVRVSAFGAAAAVITTLVMGVAACQKSGGRPPIVDDSDGPHLSIGTGSGGNDGGTDAGGAVAGRIATAPAAIRGLAATTSDVYYLYVDPGDGAVADDGGAITGGVLARVPRAGGTPQVVVTEDGAPRALTLVDGNLYWVDDQSGGSSVVRFGNALLGAVVSGLTSSSVYIARSDVIVVATPAVGALDIASAPNADAGVVQSVGSLQGQFTPVRLLLDQATVYLLAESLGGGSLYRLPLSGGVPEEIWTAGTGSVRDVAIADGRAFVAWDKGDASAIVSIPLTGGAAQTLLSPIAAPRQIAVDGSDLFYTTAAGELARIPVDGGTTTTLATDIGDATALFVSDGVYVAAGPDVLRFAR